MSILGPATVAIYAVTRAAAALPVSSSEAASLGGKKALTPIIAGSVCGGVMFLAWVIGFGIYFRKRYKRRQRNRLVADGKAAPREKDLEIPKEKIVIPPDPAVLLGQRKPGELAFPERQNSNEGPHRMAWSRHASHVRNHSSPLATPGETSPTNGSANHHISTATEGDDNIVDEITVPAKV
ncbi:hypothetical protein B0H34DRAFT_350891 [Crassisporium funariophilum]|nr:hypothetical protein B0H34DRAFT_350891 [Crassisporium funariophilum]